MMFKISFVYVSIDFTEIEHFAIGMDKNMLFSFLVHF
jgi:hypothetical protein